jgi:hypothetical protein
METNDRETNERRMTFDQLYIHAETDSERLAVGIAKANALWRAKYTGHDSLPDIKFLAQFIQPFLAKEVVTRALNEHRVIENEIVKKHMNDMSRDVMLANQKIEQHLKMEHL